MFKVDTFVFIVHFVSELWEPCHVTIGFLESVKTFGNPMALQVNEILVKHVFHVKNWVWHIHLWVHVGGMLCLNVVNIPLIILKFMLV
jgi:hypothetical protein